MLFQNHSSHIFTVNLATGQLLSYNFSKENFKGSIQVVSDDLIQKTTFYNWAGRKYYEIFSDLGYLSLKILPTEGKLGYETMWHTCNYQYNNFFSRRTKKNLLRTKHGSTYEKDGKFHAPQFVSKKQFLKTMNWCSSNKVRFEVVLTTHNNKNAVAIFYTL